jgi:D-lactate dehydrogenase (cytochrome)
MSGKKPATIPGALTANAASRLASGGSVLSSEKLNKVGEIKKINDSHALTTIQSGARLGHIKSEAQKRSALSPPDPTQKNASIARNIQMHQAEEGFKFARKDIAALVVAFADGPVAFVKRGKHFANKNGEITFDTTKGGKTRFPKYMLRKIKMRRGIIII